MFSPAGGVFGKTGRLGPKISPLKAGREWSYYEHITSAILDQKQATMKVCRSSGIGKLFEFIEKSAIAKKFSPPIFSPPLPGGAWAGAECPPVPRNRARGNATAGRTPQEGISTGRTGPPGTGGPSVFNLKTRGGSMISYSKTVTELRYSSSRGSQKEVGTAVGG